MIYRYKLYVTSGWCGATGAIYINDTIIAHLWWYTLCKYVMWMINATNQYAVPLYVVTSSSSKLQLICVINIEKIWITDHSYFLSIFKEVTGCILATFALPLILLSKFGFHLNQSINMGFKSCRHLYFTIRELHKTTSLLLETTTRT